MPLVFCRSQPSPPPPRAQAAESQRNALKQASITDCEKKWRKGPRAIFTNELWGDECFRVDSEYFKYWVDTHPPEQKPNGDFEKGLWRSLLCAHSAHLWHTNAIRTAPDSFGPFPTVQTSSRQTSLLHLTIALSLDPSTACRAQGAER